MAIRKKCPEKRKSLLNATLSLVNNNGFHDAPMSKIAKLANVSPATIYIYFENKQDLINQLYLEIKETFWNFAFKDELKNLTVKKAFEIIWFNIADFRMKNNDEAIFLSQCENTPIVDKSISEEGLKHLQPLVDLWEKGKTEGIIKPICPFLLYSFTIYPMAFLMTKQHREDYKLSNKDFEQAFQCAWDSIKL
ncbi:TetR/AcrR family transcriptional regulator [Lutibacter sp. TH_r2]|uniref:TetR/AcrR family transcriptional regulator n=1 Tax=Lutibacter sp. TH_r2 TaxID=3082083 RepID=UPI002953FACE|nr:TetR/AcrR family transcriptional regulator [Lutibacter sp. TH_r2]MDV7186406.1 TetR/AcrR family transcriptional regulator [Lutibacter sp. TH_r2]